MKNVPVISVSTIKNYHQAIQKILEHFPHLKDQIKKKKHIFIVGYIDYHYSEYLHSDTDFLKKLCEYIRNENPKAKIYLLLNNIFGFCTRLFVNLTNMRDELRRHKIKFIFLDEKKPDLVTVKNGAHSCQFNLPRIINTKLVQNRNNALLFNVSPLKTHHYNKLAGSLFHHMHLLSPESQNEIYSTNLHKFLPYLIKHVKSDFTFINATNVISHGLLTSQLRISEYSNFFNTILGSTDPLAADLASLQLLGFNQNDVKYMKKIHHKNDFEVYVQIIGELSPLKDPIAYSPRVSHLPDDLDIIIGGNRSAVDPRLGIALHFIQIMNDDLRGNAGFSLIAGNEFKSSQFTHVQQPLIVLGSSCCKELSKFLQERFNDIYFVADDTPIRYLLGVLLKVMHVDKYNLMGTNPVYAWRSALISRFKGSRYRFPSVPGRLKKWKVQTSQTKKGSQ